MRGEINLINRGLYESENNPIKKDIGKHSALHIIAVINDEYWKEWRRKMEYCGDSCIYARELGGFKINFSKCKKYIRTLIREIRKKRATLENLRKDPTFKDEESRTFVELGTLTLKLKAALSQIEENRKLYILKYLIYTHNKLQKDPTFKPKYNYTWFPYSFKDLLRNNNKIDMSIIKDINF